MEKKVKDVMVPIERYPTVSAGSSVKDVVAVMSRAMEAGPCAGGVPVLVMENNTLVGLVGPGEVMRAIEPVVLKGGTYRGWRIPAEWSAPLFLKGLFTEKCRGLSELKAGDIMVPVEQGLNAGDTLIKAVHILASGGYGTVPVWQDGRVVGMVGFAELFEEIAALQLGSEAGAASGRKQAAG
ncbi:MAG: CBS domain-containing protein [Peptococcaceae bacterium]|nr:CBS domain-containing protein [Peptococcaceae bacterium]